ncbi:MAG: AMP-dependent synthetase/ligase [Alphaproteobacteria bacterium]
MIDYASVPNLPTLFFDQADKHVDRPFLWAKRDGDWKPFSWKETADTIAALAAGLKANGLNEGDRVVIVSENRPEWFMIDVAVMAAGGISVPTYTTNTVDDHKHILSDSGATIAVVSNERLAKNLVSAAEENDIRLLISMESLPKAATGSLTVIDWQALIVDGNSGGGDTRKAAKSIDRDTVASLIYTSGTGGAPTGVMLSHGNMLCNVYGADHLLRTLDGMKDNNEVFLSFLPLSHSYEHTCGQFVPVGIGAQIYYAEGIDKLIDNIAEVRPTIMTAVPRLYESIRARILRGAEQKGGLSQELLLLAVALGRKRYEDPDSLKWHERLTDLLLDRLVRRKVKNRFGGRLKAFVSGGAPLNYDVGVFFQALGLTILQGFGQTESAPVSNCNPYTKNKITTVGPPLKGVEIRIAEDGEILIRGELVMKGYWNQPERTAETVKDGWLHTGDIGHLDEDGYLMITDRKKDIIVNSGGDNISPQRVEGMLCVEPEIAQAMVYGDKRPHLVALVVPDPDWSKSWRRDNGKQPDDDLTDDPDYRKALQEALDRVNKKLAVIERVRRFLIAKEPFTIENHMLTPSMKIRRHIIKQEHGASLEGLYR